MHAVPEFHRSGYLLCRLPAILHVDSSMEVIDEVERLSVWSTWIIADLSAVEFLDSSGVSILVWAQRRLRALGGGLVLARPSAATCASPFFARSVGQFQIYASLDDVPDRPRSLQAP